VRVYVRVCACVRWLCVCVCVCMCVVCACVRIYIHRNLSTYSHQFYTKPFDPLSPTLHLITTPTTYSSDCTSSYVPPPHIRPHTHHRLHKFMRTSNHPAPTHPRHQHLLLRLNKFMYTSANTCISSPSPTPTPRHHSHPRLLLRLRKFMRTSSQRVYITTDS